MQVKKRDGRVEIYDESKIQRAIDKAIASVGSSRIKTEGLTTKVDQELHAMNIAELDVDLIHDEVEKVLCAWQPEVAKAYILYRASHSDVDNFTGEFR